MLKTPVSMLQELAVQKKLTIPDYQFETTGQPPCTSFTCHVKTGNETAVGEGGSKKEAKHDAAANMLKVFGIDIDKKSEVSGPLPSKATKNVDGPIINYIGKLNEFSSTNRHPQPTYTDNITLQNAQFCIICEFKDLKCEGYGPTKKIAKQESAKKMFALIKEADLETNISKPAPIEKLEEDDELTEQVKKKYNELKTEDKSGNKNGIHLETTAEEVDNISSWDELLVLLDGKGYTYELTTFQAVPLILSLKINEHVLMHRGIDRDDILKKLVSDVLEMIGQGIDFSKPPNQQ